MIDKQKLAIKFFHMLTDEEIEKYMKHPFRHFGLKAKRLKPLLEAEYKRRYESNQILSKRVVR